MPTELEELVEFLHHGNTQIRQVAVEHLVGYSHSEPSIFKVNQLEPVKDLKLLVKDYKEISKNALTILINLSEDKEVLTALATDDAFLETLLLRITNKKEPNADDVAMLLANLAKADETIRILSLKRSIPKDLSTSDLAIDQLLDCFVKGAEGSYNTNANYDYLSYFFADLAKFPQARTYLTTPSATDNGIIPLQKLVPFTTHASTIRRRGVAHAIKNTLFLVDSHPTFLSTSPDTGINILPYLLLPLAGPEEYTEEESEKMLDDLQLLGEDKEREKDVDILKTHLESLLLLTSSRQGRDELRSAGTYFVVRECHANVEDEEVREAVDRLVQVVMRAEEGEEQDDAGADGTNAGELAGERITEVVDEESDEDEKVVEVL